jgi:putative membrane protein
MKHAAIIAVSAAALALASCGKKDEPVAPEGAATEASVGMATPAENMPAENMTAGQSFANTAASSDAFEIETSRLAADKGTSAKIKTFAQNMIKAHTESTAKLKTAAAAATPPVTPAPQLSAQQQQTLTELQGKSGADFDTAYAKAQVDAHQMTLDALKAYSASGDVPSLKKFATELVPIVTAHLNMAKGL